MTTTAILEPAAVRGTPLSARLRAAWGADTVPILLVGLAFAVISSALPVVIAMIVSSSVGDGTIGVTSPADAFAAICVVVSIISSGSASLGRRESVVGGWTRRERLEVIGVHTAAFAAIAVIGWFAMRAVTPWLLEVTALSTHDGERVSLFPASATPVALVAIVLLVAFGAAVPQVFVAAHRLGGLAIAGANAATIVATALIVSSFVTIGFSIDGQAPPAPLGALTIILAIVVAIAYIALAAWAVLRAPVARFR